MNEPRKQRDDEDARAYEALPQTDDEHAPSTAAAIEMIEAEDWSEWYPASLSFGPK
jgi:hypothetical protein